jgi:hypothetical protein
MISSILGNGGKFWPACPIRIRNTAHQYGTGTHIPLNTPAFSYSCCGSGMFIPDPGSEFFHPGSRIKKIPDPGYQNRIKEFKYLLFLTQKIVSKRSESEI